MLSFVLAKGPLLLSMFHDLLLHVKTFTLTNSVHILQRLISRISLFSKVQILFFSGGHPERITGDNLRETNTYTYIQMSKWCALTIYLIPEKSLDKFALLTQWFSFFSFLFSHFFSPINLAMSLVMGDIQLASISDATTQRGWRLAHASSHTCEAKQRLFSNCVESSATQFQYISSQMLTVC